MRCNGLSTVHMYCTWTHLQHILQSIQNSLREFSAPALEVTKDLLRSRRILLPVCDLRGRWSKARSSRHSWLPRQTIKDRKQFQKQFASTSASYCLLPCTNQRTGESCCYMEEPSFKLRCQGTKIKRQLLFLGIRH